MPYFLEYKPLYFCCFIDDITIKYNKKLNEKLDTIELSNWSCPVCYNAIHTKGQLLCMPFECPHLICYACLYKLCKYSRVKKGKQHKCPLCRAIIEQEWTQKKSLSLTNFKVDKKWCRMYIPH